MSSLRLHLPHWLRCWIPPAVHATKLEHMRMNRFRGIIEYFSVDRYQKLSFASHLFLALCYLPNRSFPNSSLFATPRATSIRKERVDEGIESGGNHGGEAP